MLGRGHRGACTAAGWVMPIGRVGGISGEHDRQVRTACGLERMGAGVEVAVFDHHNRVARGVKSYRSITDYRRPETSPLRFSLPLHWVNLW
jgi:hypothetical protein